MLPPSRGRHGQARARARGGQRRTALHTKNEAHPLRHARRLARAGAATAHARADGAARCEQHRHRYFNAQRATKATLLIVLLLSAALSTTILGLRLAGPGRLQPHPHRAAAALRGALRLRQPGDAAAQGAAPRLRAQQDAAAAAAAAAVRPLLRTARAALHRSRVAGRHAAARGGRLREAAARRRWRSVRVTRTHIRLLIAHAAWDARARLRPAHAPEGGGRRRGGGARGARGGADRTAHLRQGGPADGACAAEHAAPTARQRAAAPRLGLLPQARRAGAAQQRPVLRRGALRTHYTHTLCAHTTRTRCGRRRPTPHS